MSNPVTSPNKQPTSKPKAIGAKKFFKTLGLLVRFRFADATEYMIDGDTEN